MIEIEWVGHIGHTVEQCRVDEGPHGVTVHGDIKGSAAACSYTVRATADWRFVELKVVAGPRGLAVLRSERGWVVDGEARPDLDQALEVDLSVSPFSNTLPVRRLGLIGESADIITAYVRVPELEVMADPQRYTRTGALEYLYESRDSDFRRSVTVDDGGLVVEYPGLFTRIHRHGG